jgi:hypothetical protein
MCQKDHCECDASYSESGCCDHETCRCERCNCGRNFHRRYQTKAEKIADLEEYLGQLKTEVQAVEEMLADLRK